MTPEPRKFDKLQLVLLVSILTSVPNSNFRVIITKNFDYLVVLN